jgi:hypothetical protein
LDVLVGEISFAQWANNQKKSAGIDKLHLRVGSVFNFSKVWYPNIELDA